jgi:hypothetical protein
MVIGNDDDELEYVKDLSDRLGNLVKNSPLNPQQGTLALNLVCIASVKYGLPSSLLTFNHINRIHKYSMDKFISVMG